MELPKPRSLKPEFAAFSLFLCLGCAPHPASVLLGEQDLLGYIFLDFALLVQLSDHFCIRITPLLMPRSSVGVRKITAKRITTARLQGKA